MQFIDLASQQRNIRAEIDAAIARVLDHGRYIMGPEIGELEAALGEACGSPNVVTCASGTDALVMALMVLGVGPGDAVFVPSFTFAATAEAVAILGATPIFVDIDDVTYDVDVDNLAAAIAAVPAGLRPVGVIPVDLFGLPADYVAIGQLARDAGLWVIADAAQSFGASRGETLVGRHAAVTTTSFFPAKPLGCYGDGGAIFCDDPAFAAALRSVRVHGSGTDKYDNTRLGVNGRLDTLQAAILLEKLKVFPAELDARQEVARRYADGLSGTVVTPSVPEGARSSWAQYTIRVPQRDAVAADLKERGIPTAVYYPRPLHTQTAYRPYPVSPAGLATSERLAGEVLSLPMHPYLAPSEQDEVIAGVLEVVTAHRAATR